MHAQSWAACSPQSAAVIISSSSGGVQRTLQGIAELNLLSFRCKLSLQHAGRCWVMAWIA